MKKSLVLLLLLVPVLAFSQSKESIKKWTAYQENRMYEIDSNRVVISVVLENVKGTKSDLYNKAKDYLKNVYNDPNSEWKVDDESAAVIEINSVYFSFFSYTADLTIPVSYHAFYTIRVAVENDKIHVVCSAKDWIAEWSTIGFGYKAERYLVVDCIPLGKQEVFADADKTADAFLELVDRLHVLIDVLGEVLLSDS